MTEPMPDRPEPWRVVVTGAAGFIGSHVAEALLHCGARVTGVDVSAPDTDTEASDLDALLRHPAFRLVEADLRDAELSPLLAGADAVFHLAGLAGVRPSWGEHFAAYLGANVLGTQRLCEACELAGVPRLVMASSSSVYGHHGWRPSREDDPTLPVSPYGVTKLAAERLALAYASRPGAQTSMVALRYFSVYGPRQRPDMWTARVLQAALTGTAVRLHGDGRQRRDFTYVDDAVAATLAAASVPARAEVFNVGGGQSLSLLAVLRAAAEVTGREVPVTNDLPQPGDVDVTEADLTRAGRMLGYRPTVTLTDGVAQQWKWLVSRTGPAFNVEPQGADRVGVPGC